MIPESARHECNLPSILVRPMTETDLAQVAEIERMSFPTAWSANAYREGIKHPYDYSLVAQIENESGPHVAGYISSLLIPDEAMLLKIAVHPDLRRSGIGFLLLQKSIDHFRSLGIAKVWLEVRESNLIAQSFYKAHGFKSVQIRKRYYTDTNENAIVMAFFLDQSKEIPK